MKIQTQHGSIDTTESNFAQPASPNSNFWSELLNPRKNRVIAPSIPIRTVPDEECNNKSDDSPVRQTLPSSCKHKTKLERDSASSFDELNVSLMQMEA